MTVTVTEPIAGPYSPNGVTTAFGFDFKIASRSEIAVAQLVAGAPNLISSSSYSVTLAVDGEGGTVTFYSAPAAGSGKIYFISDPAFSQHADFGAEGPFTPRSINLLFDRAAIRDLRLKRELSGALRASPHETLDPLPPASSRGDTILFFQPDGSPSVIPRDTFATGNTTDLVGGDPDEINDGDALNGGTV